MSVENLVQSLHNFFPWNSIYLCHVQLTSFSARSFSLGSFAVILDTQIILVYFGILQRHVLFILLEVTEHRGLFHPPVNRTGRKARCQGYPTIYTMKPCFYMLTICPDFVTVNFLIESLLQTELFGWISAETLQRSEIFHSVLLAASKVLEQRIW